MISLAALGSVWADPYIYVFLTDSWTLFPAVGRITVKTFRQTPSLFLNICFTNQMKPSGWKKVKTSGARRDPLSTSPDFNKRCYCSCLGLVTWFVPLSTSPCRNILSVLIFTDFPSGSGSQPCALLEICEYQGLPWFNWKFSNIAWLSLILKINIKYYFCVRCIDYLCMLQNKCSHRPPL